MSYARMCAEEKCFADLVGEWMRKAAQEELEPASFGIRVGRIVEVSADAAPSSPGHPTGAGRPANLSP